MKMIEPARARETSNFHLPLEMLDPAQEQARKRSRLTPPSWEHQAFLWFMIAVLSLGSYALISHFCVTTVQVSGRSMVPTLHDGERYILNRLSFVYRDPIPGEVVVLRDPGYTDLAVKRIVAGPFDTISFKAGSVLVNGKKLKESYLAPGTTTLLPDATEKEIHLGKDQYFVLGDNRSGSEDSRYYGAITRAQIIGPILHN